MIAGLVAKGFVDGNVPSGLALSAEEAGAKTPVSMMFHLLRLTLILIFTPFLAALFGK